MGTMGAIECGQKKGVKMAAAKKFTTLQIIQRKYKA
jgi:hypothetical protein